MFEVNETTTKKQIAAELARLGIEHPSKANRDALIALLPTAAAPAAATGTGLKIEKDRPEQNGIKRPSAGGKCRAIWDALDEYRTNEGELPDAKFVRTLAAENGYNPNNASIEFYQWRKFNGITGRQPKPAAAEPAKG